MEKSNPPSEKQKNREAEEQGQVFNLDIIPEEQGQVFNLDIIQSWNA